MNTDSAMTDPGPDGRQQTPAEHAHRSLLRAFGSLKKVMEPYFAGFGISRPQWAVLIVLHRSEQEGGGGMRLRDLGERLFIQPPSVTGVVDRLDAHLKTFNADAGGARRLPSDPTLER